MVQYRTVRMCPLDRKLKLIELNANRVNGERSQLKMYKMQNEKSDGINEVKSKSKRKKKKK